VFGALETARARGATILGRSSASACRRCVHITQLLPMERLVPCARRYPMRASAGPIGTSMRMAPRRSPTMLRKPGHSEGLRRMPTGSVSSTKSMHGHTLGAAGHRSRSHRAGLHHGILPPTQTSPNPTRMRSGCDPNVPARRARVCAFQLLRLWRAECSARLPESGNLRFAWASTSMAEEDITVNTIDDLSIIARAHDELAN